MKGIMEWILGNIEWILSGIGVVILSAIVRIFWKKKEITTSYSQDAGGDANIIQAKRDANIIIKKEQKEQKTEIQPVLGNVTGHIISPTSNSKVSRRIICSGKVNGFQQNMFLWLVIEVDGLLWPKSGGIIPSADSCWEHTIREDGQPHSFGIRLYATNAKGNNFINKWLSDCQRSDSFPGLGGLSDARCIASVGGLTL